MDCPITLGLPCSAYFLLLFAGAFTLGGLVGVGELLSRYRDEPWQAAFSWPGLAYVAINGAASALALYIVLSSGWTFGAAAELAPLWQVLVAGFSAIAFFRSSLFSLRVGNEDVQVGPGAVLQIVLAAVDRAVDRLRGRRRAQIVKAIMAKVDFERAYVALPTHCFALMQNLPSKELDEFQAAILKLKADAQTPNEVKASILGLRLMTLVGEDVLRVAVDGVRPHISQDGGP